MAGAVLVFVITLILIFGCCCYCYKKKKTASKPAPNQVVRSQANAYPMQTVQPQAGYPQQDPANPPANFAPYPTNQAAPTGQQPPAKDPTGQQPPAKDPTGQQPPAPYPSSGIVATQPHVKDVPPPYAEIFTAPPPQ